MGLTGVVTEATIQMIPVETSYMLVDTERAVDLDDVMDKMLTGDDGYRYSVAWIDCQSTGQPPRPVASSPGATTPGSPTCPPAWPATPTGPGPSCPASWPGCRSPLRAACSTR